MRERGMDILKRQLRHIYLAVCVRRRSDNKQRPVPAHLWPRLLKAEQQLVEGIRCVRGRVASTKSRVIPLAAQRGRTCNVKLSATTHSRTSDSKLPCSAPQLVAESFDMCACATISDNDACRRDGTTHATEICSTRTAFCALRCQQLHTVVHSTRSVNVVVPHTHHAVHARSFETLADVALNRGCMRRTPRARWPSDD